MGTNFYYKIPLKSREKEKLVKLSIKGNLDKLIQEAVYLQSKYFIHLGKRSYGWQFLWNYNDGKFYKDNLKSIKGFLKKKGGTIYTEYNEPLTIDKFFEEINLYKDDDHTDLATYWTQHPERNDRADIYEFISEDGLRFSKSTNFS